MSVSFEVETNTNKVLKFMSRACFAAVNHVITARENQQGVGIKRITYKPFYQNIYDRDIDTYIDTYHMNDDMSWDLANKWWDYMLSLPFVSELLPKNQSQHIKAYKQGFQVDCDANADRVMLVLFLLRLPQFSSGIVRSWARLVSYHCAHPDTAFVIALGLNNRIANCNYKEGEEHTDPETCLTAKMVDRISSQTCSENSVIYNEYFTIRGAKILLNRLTSQEPDESLFNGKQESFSRCSAYLRYNKTEPKAIGRLLVKHPSKSYRRGNFTLKVIKDILKIDRVARFDDCLYLNQNECNINPSQMQEIISLIES